MDTQEVMKLIDVVIQSLTNDPSQFRYVIHVETTGLKVRQTGPGVGYVSSVTGQGIGTQITVSGGTVGDIQLVRRGVDEAVKSSVEEVLKLLQGLKAELSKAEPSRSRLERTLEGLKKTVLTPALVAAIQAAINIALTGRV